VSTAEVAGNNMRMETRFLRLRAPVEHGTRFGDWSVCWLGGWSKYQLYYLVMLVKVELTSSASPTPRSPILFSRTRSNKQKKNAVGVR
jgi:hypothetical protein